MNKQIPRRAAVLSLLSFLRQPQHGTSLNPRRNVRAQDPFFAELTGASTIGAQRRDELARSLTSTACLIDGEKTLLESKLPGSLAPGANLDVFRALGAATLAFGACLPARDIQLDFLAVDRVLEGDRQVVFNVRTA